MKICYSIMLTAVLAASPGGTVRGQCVQGWNAMPGVSGGTASLDAMTWWDPDGTGPLPRLLIAGGEFASAGVVACENIAAWNGSTWAPLGTGINGGVSALTVLSNGELVAAGTFSLAGGVACSNIAAWDGSVWHPLGSGVDGTVYARADQAARR